MEAHGIKTTGKQLDVVLCWHMHQPEYRNLLTGEFQLSWTYLHVIKDYVDMVAHLERFPQAKVVVDFSPVLLQQIDEYGRQIETYFSERKIIKDTLLNALSSSTLPRGKESRLRLISMCIRANEENMVKRFDDYRRIVEIGRWLIENPENVEYLDEQYFADLLVWYHLVWLGETVRLSNKHVMNLIDVGRNFCLKQRRSLLEIVGGLLSSIISRYRRLSEKGQIELAMVPYSHPIIPFLIDLNCARHAMPELALPEEGTYPNGSDRADWQLKKGMEIFQFYFGLTPKGCWLPEGAISPDTLDLLDELGLSWTASGEGVLNNSLGVSGSNQTHLSNQAYHLNNQRVTIFFRDDELSDLIGFTYSNWQCNDAVNNLIHRLEQLVEDSNISGKELVSIILDGENAWEYYPRNAYDFLRNLYQALIDHRSLNLTTYSEYLQQVESQTAQLSHLVSGSWIYGTFSTWLGDEYKNRGWEMLVDAKKCFDERVKSGQLTEQQIQKATIQLAVCESSDWCWWFGEYNPEPIVNEYEKIYRMHLKNLYIMLDENPPPYLGETFVRGQGHPLHGGSMRESRVN